MTGVQSSGLWSDEPTKDDLLSFDAVAGTVVDAVLDDALDPLAIGVSGSWGSGKTTILRLIEADLAARSVPGDSQVLVVPTDPWRYDPAVGAKETLIGEVLGALSGQVKETEGAAGKALKLLGKLKDRVDWAKAIQVAAKASLALQLPSVDDLTSLIKTGGGEQGEGESRGLAEFQAEFRELMKTPELAHLARVVVLVDDLDRCLYPTVVDTLETIRLFLAVPKMAFVIAADERRVADALRDRFPDSATGEQAPDGQPEHPADLYLHKIVQTTVPLPALSRFDTETYIVLLQLKARLDAGRLAPYVARCAALRREAGVLDDLPAVDGDLDIAAELTLASRLTPILYEKLRGNPRRIKRFLNDLRVRQSIASRRGISLAPDIVAKLMVLEVLLPQGFKTVLDWLAKGELRERIRGLQAAAGHQAPAPPEGEADTGNGDEAGHGDAQAVPGELPEPGTFSDDLIRWAKFPPNLADEDLTPYLYLAASFSGTPLLDAGLPSRLRDVAAKLLSSIRAQQKAVSADDLAALTAPDAEQLVQHLARAARDRSSEQQAAVLGVIRIIGQHPHAAELAKTALQAIPAGEIRPGTVMLFQPGDLPAFGDVLRHWLSRAPGGPVKAALTSALAERA